MHKKYLAILFFLLLIHTYGYCQEIRSVKLPELEKILTENRHPLLLNFWATWCVPCVEEIPYFISQVNEYRKDSLQLLLVSLDSKDLFPETIQTFIRKRKWAGTFIWLNETNADYFCPVIDREWSGAIPASLFLNPVSNYRYFHEGQLTPGRLQELLKEMISTEIPPPAEVRE